MPGQIDACFAAHIWRILDHRGAVAAVNVPWKLSRSTPVQNKSFFSVGIGEVFSFPWTGWLMLLFLARTKATPRSFLHSGPGQS